jgi:hypothetical protein
MIQLFHNTFLTLGCQPAGLPQCSAGLAWHNIVESGGAVHCAGVVRISLVVDDTKRRLRNDAGKRVLAPRRLCDVEQGLEDIGPERSRSIVNVIPAVPQHAPHISSATAGSRSARLLSRAANIRIWGAAVYCALNSGGIAFF